MHAVLGTVTLRRPLRSGGVRRGLALKYTAPRLFYGLGNGDEIQSGAPAVKSDKFTRESSSTILDSMPYHEKRR